MPIDYSDRYQKAPVEGEYYDPKGYMRLKQFRKWAKITTALMFVILVGTVIDAIIEEKPGPFFVVFFSFVILMGILGISYDHKLEQHKKKDLDEKERKQRILLKTIMISKNNPNRGKWRQNERVDT
ncbi:MAG: hypothetical protein WBO18_16120 [Gammaproteobacteria bacterium]